jgi:hypothetical protein
MERRVRGRRFSGRRHTGLGAALRGFCGFRDLDSHVRRLIVSLQRYDTIFEPAYGEFKGEAIGGISGTAKLALSFPGPPAELSFPVFVSLSRPSRVQFLFI